jgi:hypothetical protein
LQAIVANTASSADSVAAANDELLVIADDLIWFGEQIEDLE